MSAVAARADYRDMPLPHFARSPRAVLVAAVVLVLTSPVVTWWLVGDLTEPGIVDPDYMFRPLPLSHGVEVGLGIAATLAAVASMYMLVAAFRAGVVDRAWSPVVVFPALAGVVIGFSWRGLTVGVIGANIGGGLILLGGPLVVLALVTAAVASGSAARRRGR